MPGFKKCDLTRIDSNSFREEIGHLGWKDTAPLTPTLMPSNIHKIFIHNATSYHKPRSSSILLEEFFCLVDLRSQVGTAAAVRMIQHHESPVVLSYFLFGDGALTARAMLKLIISKGMR